MVQALRTHAIVLTLVLAGMLALSPRALAHPVHVTMSQMEHNTDASVLEIAMQIDAGSLEEALELRTGEPVDLEKTEGIDELVHGYVADIFFVRTGDADEFKSSAEHTFVWVGFELEDEYAWLYFEIAVPGGIDGLFVANIVLFEVEAEQANTMNLRAEEFRTSLRSIVAKPWSQIVLPKGEDHVQRRFD